MTGVLFVLIGNYAVSIINKAVNANTTTVQVLTENNLVSDGEVGINTYTKLLA